MDVPREQITGLVLAGGRGTRMGGVDKGLQLLAGRPLAAHALARLAPQVGPLLLNANRHLDAYAALGCAVVTDTSAGQPGPLAGLLAGLQRCTTPYLAAVPCDSPAFPADLVARLGAALAGSACPVAMAATAADRGCDGRDGGVHLQLQPVFCLLRCSPALADSIGAALDRAERSVERWAAAQGCVPVVFKEDGNGGAATSPFFNANTLQDLRSLQ